MQKVLLISHSQKIGGAEKCLLELVEGLINNYKVFVVLPSENENYESFKKTGCSIIIKSYPWWVTHQSTTLNKYSQFRKLLSHLKGVLTFLNIISKIKPNFIITNTVCVPSAAVASKILNKKHFWFIHELGYLDHNLKFDYGISLTTKIISFCSRSIFVNSEFVFKYYSQYINDSKFKIIDIVVPTNSLFTNSNDSFRDKIELFVIGQIQPSKGQFDAVLAHEGLLKLGVESYLYIIGNETDLNYCNYIKEYVSSNGIKNITFINHLQNPFSLINKRGIGLVCSEFEAFGRITVEFMKLRVPVIAKAAGNNVNLIDDGETGLLYRPNFIDELIEKILYLFNYCHVKDAIIESAFIKMRNRFNADKYIMSITKELS